MAIDDFLELFDTGDGYDYDSLGAVLDSDTLDKAIESFENSYGMSELIERYLQLTNTPVEYEVTECQN